MKTLFLVFALLVSATAGAQLCGTMIPCGQNGLPAGLPAPFGSFAAFTGVSQTYPGQGIVCVYMFNGVQVTRAFPNIYTCPPQVPVQQ